MNERARLRPGRPLALLLAALLAACGGGDPLQPTPIPTPMPQPSPPLVPAELRPVIEALFLGSGSLTPRDGASACVFSPGYWTGFARGQTVRVKVSTTVSAGARAAIEAAAAQVGAATLGLVQATVESVDEPLPLPGPGEVTVATHPDPAGQGCPTPVGCTIPTFGGFATLAGARAILPPNQTPNAFAHDAIGHGVLGMCHIDGALGGGPENSLMSGGPGVFSDQISPVLTGRDLRATQAVYGARVSPGAQRPQFVSAGLVDP